MKNFILFATIIFIVLAFAAPCWCADVALDGGGIVENVQREFYKVVVEAIYYILGAAGAILIRVFIWFESRNSRIAKLEVYQDAKEIALDAYKDVNANLKAELKAELDKDGHISVEDGKRCMNAAIAKAMSELRNKGLLKKLANAGIHDAERWLKGQIQHVHDVVSEKK